MEKTNQNTEGASFYITYLQLGYILHADELKFDFKLKEKIMLQQIIIYYEHFLRLVVKKDAIQQKI